MQRYIEQLIEDIHKATWNLRPPHALWEESKADPDDELELEDMTYLEQYVYGDEIPIANITGIEQERLPAPEKLTTEQKALLAEELEKLLQYFHFILDFPSEYPSHLRYPFIRNFWKEKHVALSFGENHIEFCDFEDDKCPFPGYCTTCAEIKAQLKYDEEHSSLTDDWDFEIEDLIPTQEQLENFFNKNNGKNNPEEENISDDDLPF